MINSLKKFFYFPAAWYFRFFAEIKLLRRRPRIVVVTGSNGKTTLLHMLEAQFGDRARYSHHANSSFGIPFDVLGLKRKSLLISEWPGLFLSAPMLAFFSNFKEKIYIVEADVDRPGEGKFLAEFLRPEVVLWVSTARTHGMNFETLAKKRSETVEEAIAFEFGYFLEYCRGLAVINGDLQLEMRQASRTKADVVEIKKKDSLESYAVGDNKALFRINKEIYSFPALLPEEVFYSIMMCRQAVDYFGFEFDNKFSNFVLPPGRSSVFQGIKGITIVDSCYNANLSSMTAVLDMYSRLSGSNKWVVLGDMLEQGDGEREEHIKLANLLGKYKLEKIVLMGKRVKEFTYPLLVKNNPKRKIESFLGPRETLDYLLENLQGGEIVLFKGARFMEGIIENLLLDKKEVVKLVRREEIWERRRKQWGL
jgi:UDP-N-acetylmuramoyl-tripeptide--D-alanyl-D-alanine ligase